MSLYSKLTFEERTEPGYQTTLKYKEGWVDLTLLSIWKDNPRLIHETDKQVSYGRTDVGTQQWLIDTIEAQSHFPDLLAAIKQNGDARDAILVDSTGTVREGNQTWVVYHKLGRKQIRVKVYHPRTSEMQWTMMLAQDHIGQKEKWESYNQASMIAAMIDAGHDPKKIATHIRRKNKTVSTLVSAYRLHKQAQVDSGKHNVSWFSHFLRFASSSLFTTARNRKVMVSWWSSGVVENRIPNVQSYNAKEIEAIYTDQDLRRDFDRGDTASLASKLSLRRLKGKDMQIAKTLASIPAMVDGVNAQRWDELRSNEDFRLDLLATIAALKPTLLKLERIMADFRMSASTSGA